jgi:hypothetical protein
MRHKKQATRAIRMATLQVGERFHYFEGDTREFEVVRVTPCAAYVKPVALRVRTFMVTDTNPKSKTFGETKEQERAVPELYAISFHSHVKRGEAV